MLVRIVKMNFREDGIDAFKKLFDSRKLQIRNFEGCSHLELWKDRLHPHIFFTYSYWRDADALEAYRHSELFANTWAQTKSLFAGKPEAWSVNPLAVVQ